ncbi:hypothetical protein [Roseateles sp. P5_E7]
MMTEGRSATLFVAAVFATLGAMCTARAAPTIVNGGFENGFAGWTRVDQLGGDGTFQIQTGTASPLNGELVPAPPEGSYAAMTDSFGPGAHVLYQDFMASASSAALSFQVFIGNRADRFVVPATLDFSTPALNQQARVDVLRAGADPFSVAAADILLSLYASELNGPLMQGYFAIMSDISALLAEQNGQLLRLRFAETDNVGPFQFGVDDVRITAAPTALPEPSSALLAALALVTLGGTRLRRR